MTLLDLQRSMAEAVMQPLTARYGMRKRTRDGRLMAEEAAGFIKPNSRLTSFERLEIYNRQYWFRVLSAFSEDFPALQAMVGSKQFEALARAYLEENPSRSFTLRNLGSNLETWLRSHPRILGKQHAVALDVARLEWAYVESFDNGEERALTPAEIGELNARSRLALQSHVRLIELSYPVDDFIIGVHRKQQSSSIASNAFTGTGTHRRRKELNALRRRAIFLAVHRFDHTVYYKRLQREAYRMLQSLGSGACLEEALEAAFEKSKIASSKRAEMVQQWFASWAELGWFYRAPKKAMQPPQGRSRK